MVHINTWALAKLVDHAEFEERVAPNLCILRALLSNFVDAECLSQVHKARCAVVHEVGQFETRFLLCFLLVQRHLEVAERQLLVQLKFVNLEAASALSFIAMLVEDSPSDLPEQSSLCLKDRELLKKKGSVEGGNTLAHLS